MGKALITKLKRASALFCFVNFDRCGEGGVGRKNSSRVGNYSKPRVLKEGVVQAMPHWAKC